MIEVPKYPKIQTLYVRDTQTFKVDPSQFRCDEFRLVKTWLITEKIDGTNIRVILLPDGTVTVRGRSDRAQIPPFLLDKLGEMFEPELVQSVFEPEDGVWPLVVLFGEGYGARIQKGGGNYRQGVSFRLFDVLVGDWWLNWDNVADVASNLGIRTVPYLWPCHYKDVPKSTEALDAIFKGGSVVAAEEKDANVQAEGIVARTDPLLFTRRQARVVWKLKYRDF